MRGLIRVGYCITAEDNLITVEHYTDQGSGLCHNPGRFFFNGAVNLKAGFWTQAQQDGCATFYDAFVAHKDLSLGLSVVPYI